MTIRWDPQLERILGDATTETEGLAPALSCILHSLPILRSPRHQWSDGLWRWLRDGVENWVSLNCSTGDLVAPVTFELDRQREDR